MIRVPFVPDELTGDDADFFHRWSLTAEQKTREVISEYVARGKIAWTTARRKVWAEFRDWLAVRRFNKKCSYCQTDLRHSEVDAEHFRPKGAVTQPRVDGAAATSDVMLLDGTIGRHPGYFWLAFHWKNLLPACPICNRGKKRNYFPAERYQVFVTLTDEQRRQLLDPEGARPVPGHEGIYLLAPDDLDAREQRLVLNPLFDQPNHVIRFSRWGGKVLSIGGDPVGHGTISAFGLDSKDLNDLRHEEQRRSAREFRALQGQFERKLRAEDDPDEALRRAWQEIRSDLGPPTAREFSAACRDSLVQEFFRDKRHLLT